MKDFLYRALITAFGMGIAAYLVPGIIINSLGALFFSAVLLGVVNAVVRPILIILTLPATILTLGLFILFINALMFLLVARLIPGFYIQTFGAAFLGYIIVTVISWVISSK
ncbi:hypothetical protein CHISP_1860 [Chitinispirillum alkaliphilum]|nr:hypothetical protein CHISP_1860 [Chitinispirillum alkaliphilum]